MKKGTKSTILALTFILGLVSTSAVGFAGLIYFSHRFYRINNTTPLKQNQRRKCIVDDFVLTVIGSFRGVCGWKIMENAEVFVICNKENSNKLK